MFKCVKFSDKNGVKKFTLKLVNFEHYDTLKVFVWGSKYETKIRSCKEIEHDDKSTLLFCGEDTNGK